MPDNTLSDQELSPPLDQPQSPPADQGSSSPAYDPRIDQFERSLSEMRRQNELILQALNRNASVAPPVPVQEPPITPVSTEDFLKDPVTHIAKVIESKLKAELKTTIEPLQRFASDYRRGEEYNALKARMRNQYGNSFTEVEGLVDGLIQGSPGAQINEETMQQAFAMAVGTKQLGWAGGNSGRQAPPPVRQDAGPPSASGERRSPITPPSAPPTAPAAPGSPQRAPTVNLSDIERRLKNSNPRTRGMSDEEYAAVRDSQNTSDWLKKPEPVLDQNARR
jgi:hypothetical protein